MSQSSKYLCILIFAFFFGKDLLAQFTYGGLRFSYYNARFDNKNNSVAEDLARINDLVVNIDLFHRPLRNVGFGISTRIPILQGFRYSYTFDSDYSTSQGGTIAIEDPSLAGGVMDYDISLKSSISLFARFFFSTEDNIFLDVRYTAETYNETLMYVREGNSSLPSENINLSNSVKGSGIGFAAGYIQKISDHFYSTTRFGIDFISANSGNLAVIKVSDYSGSNNETRNLTIPSKIADKNTILEFSYGIGYTF